MLGYTLAQVTGYARAVDRIERDRLRLAAVAARVGGAAESKDFERWVIALEDE